MSSVEKGRIDVSELITVICNRSFSDGEAVTAEDKVILVEVAMLCMSRDFELDVMAVRIALATKYGVRLPLVVRFPVKRILSEVFGRDYIDYYRIISSAVSKYGLSEPIYNPRHFLNSAMTVFDDEENDRDDQNEAKRLALLASQEAVRVLSNTKDPLSLMDRIILYNDPIGSKGLPSWLARWHDEVKRGVFDITAYGPDPHIAIRFPLHATKMEMKKLLENNLKHIAKARAVALRLGSGKNSYSSSHVDVAIFAHNLRRGGLKMGEVMLRLDAMEGQRAQEGIDHELQRPANVKKLAERLGHEIERRFGGRRQNI